MNKYIKLFTTHSEYEAYMASQDKVLPNVSLCDVEEEVHYNPFVETRVVATFNVTSTSSATYIMNGGSSFPAYFSEIEIDGVVQDTVTNSYMFSTTGTHTVKYTLVDPTVIPNSVFSACSLMTSVFIPNGVTSINTGAFMSCAITSVVFPSTLTTIGNNAFTNDALTSIVIPAGVTSIIGGAFDSCFNLSSVTLLPTTPPTLGSTSAFGNNASGRKFYVPAASVDAYKAATNWSGFGDDIVGKML